MKWPGRVLGGLAAVFLAVDAAGKIAELEPVLASFREMGLEVTLAPTLGVVELLCVALFVVPKTSRFGAVLLTGYLGGAVATHLKLGSPLATHTLFPVYLGAMIWLSLVGWRAGKTAVNSREAYQ